MVHLVSSFHITFANDLTSNARHSVGLFSLFCLRNHASFPSLGVHLLTHTHTEYVSECWSMTGKHLKNKQTNFRRLSNKTLTSISKNVSSRAKMYTLQKKSGLVRDLMDVFEKASLGSLVLSLHDYI